jgi:hypothetical protein
MPPGWPGGIGTLAAMGSAKPANCRYGLTGEELVTTVSPRVPRGAGAGPAGARGPQVGGE